jgi:hypothetical protein
VNTPDDIGSIFGTAFWTLGVSTRDDPRRILEAAEEKSLTLDPAVCSTCRDLLTNPRKRLREEMRWLPGVSPKRAAELASMLRAPPHPPPQPQQLPTLAAFNVQTTALGKTQGASASLLESEISNVALLAEDLKADAILREVNEDRAIGQFPIARLEQVEEEIALLKTECAARALRALGALPTAQIITLMTSLAEDLTSDPDVPPPDLFATLVEMYEVEAQQFLLPEAEKIEALCDAVRKAASAGEQAIAPLLNRLDEVVRRWDNVAQPFQLLAYSRGLDHAGSATVGRTLRSLSLDLHNDLQMSNSAKHVSELCNDVFAELPEFSERVRDDLDTLVDIAERNESDAASHAAWEREITYEGEVGSFVKHRIAISPRGVEWKDATFPLERITALRWGGTRGRYGSNYSIVLSGAGQTMDISFGNHSEVFAAITDRLWRSAGVQILLSTLNELRAGKRIYFGQVLIDDASVELKQRKTFGGGGVLRYPWTQIGHASHNGELWLSSADRKAQSILSFLYDNNAHVLSALLNMRQEKRTARLSEVLRS